MVRLFLFLPLCLALIGCGKNIRPKEQSEPCTRTSQCQVGLVCLAGVCADAGIDASIDPDAGS